jgi:hypothetical protein
MRSFEDTFRSSPGVPEWPDALIITLRPQDGYIYAGKGKTINCPLILDDYDAPVKLYRSRHADPVELPVLAKEMEFNSRLRFSDYTGRYVLIPHTTKSDENVKKRIHNGWPAGSPYPIYLISPDGKTDRIDIPYGRWHPWRAFPTRQGLFWTSTDLPIRHDKISFSTLFTMKKTDRARESRFKTSRMASAS